MACLRCYPSICLEGLRKGAKILSQVSWPPGHDLNLGPPEYEVAVYAFLLFKYSALIAQYMKLYTLLIKCHLVPFFHHREDVDMI